MFDYRLLQALAAVVEQQGFEKAARQLCLTQSAVSRRIQQLEHLLGQPVLVRVNPPKPTAVGWRLLSHLQQVRQMEHALGLGDSPATLTVRLATNADSLASWLPAALAAATAQASALRFELLVEDQSVGLKRMQQGDVMACICDSPAPVSGGAVSYLGALRYRAVASPALIDRYQLTPLAPERLLSAPCLVFNAADQLQHQYVQQQTGQLPQQLHYCPSAEGFLLAVQAGLGFGLLPELQIKPQLASGQLLELTPGYQLDTPLYWHHWQTESPLLTLLRHCCLVQARQKLVQPD